MDTREVCNKKIYKLEKLGDINVEELDKSIENVNDTLKVQFVNPLIFTISNKDIDTNTIDDVLHFDIDVNSIEFESLDKFEDNVISVMLDVIAEYYETDDITLNQLSCEEIMTIDVSNSKMIDINSTNVNNDIDDYSKCNLLVIIDEITYNDGEININMNCKLVKLFT